MNIGQRGPATEILRLLQRLGPLSVKALESELGVSTNAVREQLQHLMAAGLITASKVRRGVGRPAHLYALSDQAQELFPTSYDVLLKLVLEALVQKEGIREVQHVLNTVGERLADNVTGGVRNPDLRAQVEVLSAALADRGIPIAVVEAGESITLLEWCCPFYSLAREHDGICEMEQRMLEHALGAKVTLAERRLDGHTGCKFVVESSPS